MKSIQCNQTPAWQRLLNHANTCQKAELNLIESFKKDPLRFKTLSFNAPHIFADLSKQHINQTILADLITLAQECSVEAKRDAMLQGQIINTTENRQALHTALRSNNPSAPYYSEIQETLNAFLTFSEKIRHNDNITDIVNIGIGGSDLGPRMATQALMPLTQYPNKRYHFVSNVDGFELAHVLQSLDPNKTLFIIVSKTFATQETLANAHSAKAWFISNQGKNIAQHFVAVTTHIEAAKDFGIEHTFGFWDWVGGRYSVWSAVGLILAIAIGRKNFEDFLCGARQMDEHFAQAPVEKNLPILLGLVDIWNRNFLKRSSRCIAPYHQGLARFAAYLQQLEMESNGKCTTQSGQHTSYATSATIWGEAGTNCQHAFFQMLHQGTDIIPVDFILAKKALLPAIKNSQTSLNSLLEKQHTTLLLNGLAQSRALMLGKSYEQALQELVANAPTSSLDATALAHHRTFVGNRPSSTLLMECLTPQALGALIALHEHRTFVCGAIWDIDSFDQWGVELGKTLAKELATYWDGNLNIDQNFDLDASTLGLLQNCIDTTKSI